MSEVIDLNAVNWKPCSTKLCLSEQSQLVAKLDGNPLAKYVVNFAEHSVKAYSDDVTLISSNFDIHMTLLQTVNQREGDLNLSFKPVKCISYLFDGSKCLQKRIPLSKGVTRLITEGGTKI